MRPVALLNVLVYRLVETLQVCPCHFLGFVVSYVPRASARHLVACGIVIASNGQGPPPVSDSHNIHMVPTRHSNLLHSWTSMRGVITWGVWVNTFRGRRDSKVQVPPVTSRTSGIVLELPRRFGGHSSSSPGIPYTQPRCGDNLAIQ